jgi:hypothetical protein
MSIKQKPQLGKGMAALLGGGPIGANLDKPVHEQVSAKIETRTVIEHQPMMVPVERSHAKSSKKKIFSSSQKASKKMV